MTNSTNNDRLQKTTSEKPVSLHPIPFDEALRDILSVKPPPKETKKKHKKTTQIKSEALIAFLFYQTSLQQQLIEAQQKVIELQQRIDSITPKAIVEKDEFWHIVSGGVMSEDAANSDDLETVKRFKTWNVKFAEKNIKPYVNPQVYNETLNQMTRGLPTRISQLETKAAMEKRFGTASRIIQVDNELRPDSKKDKPIAAAQ